MTPGHCVILGETGQVAVALAQRLSTGPWRVTALGRASNDLSDPASTRDNILRLAPDVVINAAAYTAVDKAESDPDAATALNVTGPAAAAAAARVLGVPFVHFSTDYVFDGSKGRPYLESDPTSPLGIYGATKLAGEQAIAEANPAHIILRTSWVCSPTGSNFVKTMLRLAADRDEIGVVADQRGQPTFADDLAQAVLTLLDRWSGSPDPSRSGVFHLAGATETNWCAFAQAILQGSSIRGGPHAHVRAITTADYPTPVHRPADSRLDCGRIEEVYGIRLPAWPDALEDCLDALLGKPVKQA